MRQELKPGTPPLRPTSTVQQLLLAIVTAVGGLTGTKTAILDRLAYADALQWLATGYRMYTASQ